MSIRNSRRTLLSLCFLSLSAASACAQAGRAVDSSFIDPNGLEVDGAGAVESPALGTTDVTLLIVWVTLALGMIGITVVDRRRLKQSEQGADSSSPSADTQSS